MDDFQQTIKKYLEAKGMGVPDALNQLSASPALSVSDLAMQDVTTPPDIAPSDQLGYNQYLGDKNAGPGSFQKTIAYDTKATHKPGDMFTKLVPSTQNVIQGIPASLSPSATAFEAVASQNPEMKDFLAKLNEDIMKEVPQRQRPVSLSPSLNKLLSGQISPEMISAEQEQEQVKPISKKQKSSPEVATKEQELSEQKQNLEQETERPEKEKEEPKKKYTIEELEAKQEVARKSASIMAGQMQAMAGISAITGQRIDTSGFRAQMENDLKEATDYNKLIDEQRADEVQEMRKKAQDIDNEKALLQISNDKAAHDPNSQISIAAQGIASELSKRIGLPPEKIKNLSYSTIEKLMPGIDKIIQAQLRADYMKQMASEKKESVEQKREDKLDTEANKLQQYISNKFETMNASSRSGVGRAQATVMAAERASGLLEKYNGNLNKVTPQDMQELARVMDNMLSGGTPTVTGTAKLVPTTALSSANSLYQWLSNEPTGIQQKQFVENFMKTINSEKKVANQQLDAYRRRFQASLIGNTAYARRKSQIDDYINMQLNGMGNEYTDAIEGAKGTQTQKMPQTSDVVTVVGPSGATAKMTKENAQKYLSKPGYRLVE